MINVTDVLYRSSQDQIVRYHTPNSKGYVA